MREETRLGTPARGPSEIQPDGDDTDDWAPINRGPMRDEVDRFRNTRVTVPTTLAGAFLGLALALELYEHAREIEREAHEEHAAHMDGEPEIRERAIGYLLDGDEKAKVTAETRTTALGITGDRSASSRTAAEKLVDLVPFVVAFNAEARRLHRIKLDADKEVSVARRRHDTCKLFADRMPMTVLGERPASFTGDVRVDGLGGRMTAEEVRAAVRDTASRRGGFTSYEDVGTKAERPDARIDRATGLISGPIDDAAPAIANGETLTIDGGTVTP